MFGKAKLSTALREINTVKWSVFLWVKLIQASPPLFIGIEANSHVNND